jgi:ribonucleoside-diphosphate reductase beta chain
VASTEEDVARFHSPSYLRLFGDELPRSLDRLRTDPSPVAQAEASATYNMIVEGVLAETGYHAYHTMLSEHGILPGTMRMIELLKRDESRHIAYGVFLLSRLVAEHGDEVRAAIDRRMGELLPLALGTIQEIFDGYEKMPFGLALDDFVGFAMSQFQSRLGRIERAATGAG